MMKVSSLEVECKFVYEKLELRFLEKAKRGKFVASERATHCQRSAKKLFIRLTINR